jgi:hypothetical protein
MVPPKLGVVGIPKILIAVGKESHSAMPWVQVLMSPQKNYMIYLILIKKTRKV